MQELDSAALLASPSNPEPQLPSAEAMHQLPYLDAVIHEGLRCFPPVPSGVGRALSEEVTVCGHTIPANVVLCFPIWTIHHSEEIWGADAGRWRPGRWLEGRSIAAAKKDAQGHARWLPFTLGPQNCLGQHLATVRFVWKLQCCCELCMARCRCMWAAAPACRMCGGQPAACIPAAPLARNNMLAICHTRAPQHATHAACRACRWSCALQSQSSLATCASPSTPSA